MKHGIRIAAFASGPIETKQRRRRSVILVGVIWRNGMLEGVLSNKVRVDGSDATEAISRTVAGSRFGEQVRLVALNGIALAGLNIVDTAALQKRLGIAVVVVTRGVQKPDDLIGAIESHSANKTFKTKSVEANASIKLRRAGGFYFRSKENLAERMVTEAASALRLAHMIARGVSSGESKGRI
jgi:endonuclease V-like protein UPF0215 family